MEYGIHGKRRMFDGRLYRAWGWFPNKAGAKQEATERRRAGIPSRIIKCKDGYDLYVRG